MRQGAEHLCLIRPKGDALALETIFLAEDVNSQAEIEEAVADSEVKDAELGLAQQVIDSLVGDFDPQELTSEYRQNLRQMLEAKLEGQEIVRPEQPGPRCRSSTSWTRSERASPRSRSRSPRRRKPPRRAAPVSAWLPKERLEVQL